jgi:PAS domain S-box-containing protein
VDDEATIRSALSQELRLALGEKYSIETAEDGNEALELLDDIIEEGTPVPLIIADQIMPRMKGDEFLIAAHKRLPETYKIMLTGQAGVEAVSNAVNSANLYRYISKPWDKMDLRMSIEKAVEAYFQTQEMHALHAELKQSEQRLRQFMDVMPVGLMVADKQGETAFINQRGREIMGIPPEQDLTGHDPNDLCAMYYAASAQIYPREQQPLQRALRNEQCYVDDMMIRLKDRDVPLEAWGKPIVDSEQQISYAMAIFQDISERRRAEQDRVYLAQEREAKNVALRMNAEIEAKNEKLIQLNQEKNEFLGIAAHDLKNPLSAIIGLAEEIRESFDDMPPEEVIEYAEKIHQASDKMFALITNLLDVNAIESGNMDVTLKATDIFPVVDNLVRYYQRPAKAKDIDLRFHHDGTVFIALVDESTTHQVLDNLISNAVKYSPHGKVIDIRLLRGDAYLRCEIQDQGPGLNAEDKAKLFGKFNRLSAKPTGGEHSTGLGLFIVKKLVEAMRGKVWCDSEPGQGACFSIELPKLRT